MIRSYSCRAALRALSVVPLMVFGGAALAKTWYVAKEGEDNAFCGARTQPCASIGHALDELAGTNDKIIVGPGRYDEVFTIDIEGLKLESSAGRWGTIIASSGNSVIRIRAAKVQIGRKGKGFTLQGANSPGDGYGITVTADTTGERIRIEGNRMTENFGGIQFQPMRVGATDLEQAAYQAKPVIRYNDIVGNDSAYGITCNGCGGGQIFDNRIVGNGRSFQSGNPIYLSHADKVSVSRNVVSGNEGFGSYIDEWVKGAKIKDNVFDKTGGEGLYVFDGDGMLLQSNILSQNGAGGVEDGLKIEQQSLNQKPIQIKNNLVVASTSSNIQVYGQVQDIKIEGNTSVDSLGGNGFDLADPSSNVPDFVSFRNNTSIGSHDCGIYLDGIIMDFRYQKHFFANNDDELCGSGTVDTEGSSTNGKPSPLKVNKARSL